MARALLAALALSLVPLAAQPLDPDAPPASGTLSPSEAAVSAAFDVRPDREVPDGPGMEACVGYVGDAPDVVVDWAGGDLQVWTEAAFDATLTVAGPDGVWHCNDDFNGASPVVQVMDAEPGRYVVWLGSFSPSPFERAATLWAGPAPPPPVLDPDAPAQAGTIDAEAGFEAAQGAIEVAVTAGGPDDAERLDLSGTPSPPDFCGGSIEASQPTAAVAYSGDGVLVISASSFEADLVLVVRAPSGRIVCNDDFNGLDPAVVFASAESGTYTAWVGTFSGGMGTVPATLTVAETEPEGQDFFGDEFIDEGFAPYSEGTYTPLDLGVVPSTRVRAGSEGGSATVTFTPTALNPVSGPSCTGYIETAPTAAIELDGDGPFALTASSEDDLTLTVRTPSGGWFCSDDADGLDPGIQIDAPEAGTYLAWVGTFSDIGAEAEATIRAEPGELQVSETSFGFDGPRNDQSDGAYTGSAIRTGGAAATLAFDGDGMETAEVVPGGTVRNPVEGGACFGYVSERPVLDVESASGLSVSASSDEDLTLVVRGPDGSWTCSDDSDGTDPEAIVEGGEGTYSIWVGTYFRRPGSMATVRVGPVPPSVPRPPPPPEVIRG